MGNNTPQRLLEVSINGNLEEVQHLIQEGANLDVKDYNGLTPLHCAACNGHLKVVECLVQAGATLDVKTNDGWTPLHYAAINDHLEVIMYLVQAGADYRMATNKSKTVKEMTQNRDILDFLQQCEDDDIPDIKEPNCY